MWPTHGAGWMPREPAPASAHVVCTPQAAPVDCVALLSRGSRHRAVCRYLPVTDLHFRQNDRDLLRATAVTRGWNGYRNESQHSKLTPERSRQFPCRDSNPRPFGHCTPNKSVPTLRYTRRHGPIYTGHACRGLPTAVPWISEDRLLRNLLYPCAAPHSIGSDHYLLDRNKFVCKQLCFFFFPCGYLIIHPTTLTGR